MSDTTIQSEAWQRDMAERNKAIQVMSRQLVDLRRQHAQTRETLTALVQSWRDQSEQTRPPLPAGGHVLVACADELAETLTHGGQG
jgi:uncharacterized coiled-coil protein SlyX